MKLNDILRFGKSHAPELLTGVCVISVPIANYLFVRAAKKEEKDHDKRHYILPGVVSGITIASALASNRFSNEQKAELIAAGIIASNERLIHYQDVVKEKVEPEVFKDINKAYTEKELERLSILCDEEADHPSDEREVIRTYYFPQLRIRPIQCSEDVFLTAELKINEILDYDEVANVVEFFDAIDPKIMKRNFFNLVTDASTGGIDIYERDFPEEVIYNNLGWMKNSEDPMNGLKRITFTTEVRMIEGKEIIFVYFNEEPLTFDEWDEYYNAINKDGIIHPNDEKEDRLLERMM